MVVIVLEGHQARIFVRGSSKQGYRSYGVPLNKSDLKVLGLSDAKGQTVELRPLNDGHRGVAVTVGDSPDAKRLIFNFMQNLDRDVQFWLHAQVDDFDDPMWYNALSTMLKLLVLTSAYQFVSGPSKMDNLEFINAKIETILVNSQQTELQDDRTVLQTLQWLSKVKPAMIIGLINRVATLKKPGDQYPVLQSLYDETINQYFSFMSMAQSEKTQQTLVKMFLSVNDGSNKMSDVIKNIHKGVN